MMRVALLLVLLLGLEGSVSLRAQDQRAKVAEAYEQSGDYRSAARLWQELLAASPNSDQYFYGVARTLKALDNYNALLDIVRERIKKKKNVTLLSLYAQVLFKNKLLDEANDAWREAMRFPPVSIETFKEVAASQIEIRLVDQTVETYMQARTVLNNEILFADELAQLFALKGDYKSGIKEVLNAFELSGNLQQAQGRLSAYMVSDTATRYLDERISKVSSSRSDSYAFQKLHEWFLRETKQHEKAFQVVQRLDKITRSNGRELIIFAEQSRAEAQYDVALRAYSAVIDYGKSGEFAQSAYYGYARALESRAEILDTSSNTALVHELLQRYRELIRNFPNSSIASESQLHIARLTASKLRNTAQAIEEYQTLITKYNGHMPAGEGAIELGNVHLMSDDIQRARSIYLNVASQYARVTTIRDRAKYMLAELHFFTSRFDSAKALYDEVAMNTDGEYANDAIDRSTIIAINAQDSALLRTYAAAQYKAFQKKYADAITELTPLFTQKQVPDLAEASLFDAAHWMLEQKNTGDCRKFVSQLADLNRETIYGDRLLSMLAQTYVLEGNKAEAIRIYQRLLESFPRSILIQEAREKIRKLRGDA